MIYDIPIFLFIFLYLFVYNYPTKTPIEFAHRKCICTHSIYLHEMKRKPL